MITLGAKLYFGLSAAAVAAAMVLGLASGGSLLGVISFAWSGPVGDQLGFTVLVGTAAIAFFLGVITTAFRDADAEAVVEVAGTDELPAVVPPAHLSPWPIVAAFGAASLVVGLVVDIWLIGIGLVLLAASAIEWTVGAWSDRATGDPAANRAVRNRLMAPIETPAAAAFGVFVFVFFASRVLLSVSKWGAVAIFGGAALLVLIVASVIATRPTFGRSALTALVLLGGLALVGGGVAGLAAGEREFHYAGHDGDNGEHEETQPLPDGVDETDPPGLGLDADDDENTAGDTEE
jgi:hypothetical protein